MSEQTVLGNVIRAMKAIGGQGTLPQIYKAYQQIELALPPEWKAEVRGTIYHNSSDAPAHVPGNPRRLSENHTRRVGPSPSGQIHRREI